MGDDATHPCRGSNPETLCHRELKPPPERHLSIRQHRSCFRLHQERLRRASRFGSPTAVGEFLDFSTATSGRIDRTGVIAPARWESTFALKALLLSFHNIGELMSPPLPNRRIGSSSGVRHQSGGRYEDRKVLNSRLGASEGSPEVMTKEAHHTRGA